MNRKATSKKVPKKARDQQRNEIELRQKAVRFRLTLVALVLGLGMALAAGRSFFLQTHYHEALNAEARRNYVSTTSVDERRGDIYDRNGALMAVTVHRWAVTVDPRFVVSKEETATLLARLLGVDYARTLRRLEPVFHNSAETLSSGSSMEAARRYVRPVVTALAKTFVIPETDFQRSMELMSYFYQMEQLQVPGMYKVVNTVKRAARVVADMVKSEVENLGVFTPRGRKFAYIDRDLDDNAVNRVTNAKATFSKHCGKERKAGRSCHNPLRAVHIKPEPKRYYPKREIATQYLGRVGRNNRGSSGVERMLDGFLSSGQHKVTKVRDRRGRAIYLHGIDPESPLAPHSVELAIDEKIQSYAEHIINEACLVSGARAGYAVVMDVRTGEVLAAANFPAFNPNDHNTWYQARQPLRNERKSFEQAWDDLKWAGSSSLLALAYPENHKLVFREASAALHEAGNAFIEQDHAFPNASRANAFLDVYEPGSVTKVFTVAAALDQGVVEASQVFDLENGLFLLDDKDKSKIRDTSPKKSGDVALIIQKSSNIGATKIGFELGMPRLERYLRDFGFGSSTRSGFPGEASGYLRPAKNWTEVGFANIAFGQGFSVTGIQLVRALSALGNGGKLMRPILVRRVIGNDGQLIREYKPEVVRQVVSAKTARTVLDLMRLVVQPGGTGTRAYIPAYPVAGKTGTGQKPHLKKRGYADDMWVSTFFGLAPADNPRLAVAILIDEPKGERHGGGVFAAPPFRKITSWSLKYLGVPSPYDSARQVAWVDPVELAKRRAAGKKGADTTGAFVSLAPPTATGASGTVVVPVFKGMTMDKVRQLAYASGLKVTYIGSGLAAQQDLPPNTRVPGWSRVRVLFSPRSSRPRAVAKRPPTKRKAVIAGGGSP
jgi:stage V sporulation protein D (sporulation-specific penicillin-binding protein)